jgi:hypothetical protein
MEDLSQIGRDLYNLLYKEGKIISGTHPLESYIFAIDSNLDDDSLLRVIGERIGIYIDDSEDAAVSLYLKLKKYLETETDVNRTETLINMSYQKYNNPAKYANRLLE